MTNRSVSSPCSVLRIQQFLRFCVGLEEHTFFRSHNSAGSFALKFSLPAAGDGKVGVDFDELHLESFLMRLRQFLKAGELFFYKDMHRAAVDLFGQDADFRSFYDRLVAVIGRPFAATAVRAYKANQQELIEGFTLPDLMDAFLYTGRVHSERLLVPTPGSAEDGLSEAHPVTKKRLSLWLAPAALKLAGNIFAFRTWILLMARESKKVELLPELDALDGRSAPTDVILRRVRRTRT